MENPSLPGTQTIRILIVDDHLIVRAGLKMLLENQPNLRVIGEADSYSDALTIAGREQPDIIILDIAAEGESGVDYIPRFLTVSRQSRVLILTGLPDVKLHKRAIQVGAMGLLLKHKPVDVLLKAIEKIHSGEAWIDRVTMANVLTELAGRDKDEGDGPLTSRINTLTKREREIIALVALGLKNKQIGARLSISDITVRHHLTAIFDKLDVADRFELIIFAYRHGLCAPLE